MNDRSTTALPPGSSSALKSLPLETLQRARLGYQKQDATMTLRQGLEEYFEANPGLYKLEELSEEGLAEYLTNHDVSHVVFGTQTTLQDEFIQDLWTFLAIDISIKAYVTDFIATEESKKILKALTIWGLISSAANLVVKLPAMLWRTLRMKKRWPWRGWEEFLDSPLGEIRSEFNIRIF